jgi:hypothetical protein
MTKPPAAPDRVEEPDFAPEDLEAAGRALDRVAAGRARREDYLRSLGVRPGAPRGRE